jgi:hypothetical protein
MALLLDWNVLWCLLGRSYAVESLWLALALMRFARALLNWNFKSLDLRRGSTTNFLLNLDFIVFVTFDIEVFIFVLVFAIILLGGLRTDHSIVWSFLVFFLIFCVVWARFNLILLVRWSSLLDLFIGFFVIDLVFFSQLWVGGFYNLWFI